MHSKSNSKLQLGPAQAVKNIQSRRQFGLKTVLAIAAPFSFSLLASGCSSENVDLGMSLVWRDGGVKNPEEALRVMSTEAKGFVLGSQSSPRVAYVMFDPLCPHCAALWRSANPVAKEGQVSFVWIPAAVVSQKSFVIATSIYQAQDPVATMDAHEVLMSEKKGGMTADMRSDGRSMAAVQSNGDISMRLGLQEVPLIVMADKSGKAIVSAGSLTEERLRKFLAR